MLNEQAHKIFTSCLSENLLYIGFNFPLLMTEERKF